MATVDDNPLQIIDISDMSNSTADQLLNAASTQGFLMLEGHDFTQAEVDCLFNLSKDFFDLPYDTKSKFAIDDTNRGYTGIGVENLEEDDLKKSVGDFKEAFNFAHLNLQTGKADQDLPDIFKVSENEEIISSTIIKLRKVLFKLLELLAISLKIDENEGGSKWFIDRHDPTLPQGSAFRLLHYPTLVKPGMSKDEIEDLKKINVAGAHTDYGCVTLLFQREDEDGLEIYSPDSKKWESVPFVPASPKYKSNGYAPPLVVNIADQLCYWTNGLLKSTIHRVRFPSKLLDQAKPRYSIVFFVHPANDTILEPVPADEVRKIKGRGAAHYLAKHGVSISARQHLEKRLAATYGWNTY
ncbi:hypothetical protein CANARDRAFT_27714 [[Candida] arabinofermentans NRRL YB-2248]|uniref:Fe2OG dioxygenase domain-containing protein n=1 Tax=[Candida] arabinofermentans NRRL YB-2248 TaxID=983967 RepID=A0A1E4T472_9ASCO|nr:hypothetical protein CANARDRAFT_27714 [[Candida] arabinofermentans NRRL YB-2248]